MSSFHDTSMTSEDEPHVGRKHQKAFFCLGLLAFLGASIGVGFGIGHASFKGDEAAPSSSSESNALRAMPGPGVEDYYYAESGDYYYADYYYDNKGEELQASQAQELTTTTTGTPTNTPTSAPTMAKSAKAKSTKSPTTGEHYNDAKSKKSKSSKVVKPEQPNSLVALVQGVVPIMRAGHQTTPDMDLIGTATLRFNQDKSFLVAMDLNGLPGGESGSVVITEGTSCLAMVATPFTKPGADMFDGVHNKYDALQAGISKSAFRFNSGYDSTENMGKTVMVYSGAGAVLGCGPLEAETKIKVLKAVMGTYPGYVGNLNATGMVTATFHDDSTFKFEFDVRGLEANCKGCGIRIHAGVSCATNAQVKGHGWNSGVVQDLWTPAGGAVYNATAAGEAKGYIEMYNGFGYEENHHHAVVIHLQDGKRVGCGLLM